MTSTRRLIFLFISVLLYCMQVEATNTRLEEVFNWKELDFQFSNDEFRKSVIETEQFIPGNAIITGIEVYMDRLFISVPRIKMGVPSTLNYVSLKDVENGVSSPVLIPYPSLEDNLKDIQTSTPPLLVSVFRITADACSRLWAIDTGVKNIFTDSQQREIPPTIHVFDLKTDELLFSYSLKQKTDYVEEVSLFPNIIVDVTSGNCDDAFAYLPDVGAPAIVVYSLKSNETHRLTHNYFHFDPTAGDFYFLNKHYQWQDGLFGLALSPIDKDNYRTVYFHPLASTMEFTVSSRILQNNTISDKYLDSFRILGDRGSNSQSSVSVLDEETGIIFYTQVVKNAVICWNSYKGEEYSPNTIGMVADDPETMAFPNDIKIDKEGNIWVLTDKLPELIYSTPDLNVINMRIYRATVREAIKGTICD
ncbi:protein yellow-like [Lycorma delicatula]|uniref:protein yellow-like n=1 Tax=Lycorma delicatula TaxID=130591 RepID=UPI003F515086